MQTILGAGGAIGVELARALKDYTNHIRLVSRNPQKVNDSDELVQADLLKPGELLSAVKGSSVVYVTIGFKYNLKVWQAYWPVFVKNVVEACEQEGCKLVFFDNIYMYDKNHLDGMDEDTPINPPSKKGKVRADIAAMIMQAVEKGRIKALIARCADYYGPGIKNTSMLTETVFDPLYKGKNATWMGPLHFKHAFTFTPDAGIATAMLGNDESAYNQIWHLPTAGPPPTGKEWVEAIAAAMNVKPKSMVATRFIMKVMGLFQPILKEMPEMMYQYDRHYVFNSGKFERQYNFKPTPYEVGIKKVVEHDYAN